MSFENHYFDENVVKIQMEDELDEEDNHQTSNESYHFTQAPKPKRQKSCREDPLSIKKSFTTGWPTDDCGVYGCHIANKLRKYKPKTRALVEHAINNIIFEADMGRYDNVMYQPINSTSGIWNPTVSVENAESSYSAPDETT